MILFYDILWLLPYCLSGVLTQWVLGVGCGWVERKRLLSVCCNQSGMAEGHWVGLIAVRRFALLVTPFRGLSKAILGALLGEGGEAGILSCILQREKPKSTRSENIPLQSHLHQLPKWEPATFPLEGAESNSPSNYLKYKWEEQVLEKQNRKRGNKERGQEGEREVKRAGTDRADMGQGGG